MNPIDRFECSECGKVYARWSDASECCDPQAEAQAAKNAEELDAMDREPITDEDRHESQKQIDLYKARRGLMG